MGSRRPRYSRCFSRYDPKEKFRRGGARSRSLRAIAEVSRGDVTGRINEFLIQASPTSAQPIALQLRFLQTTKEISSEHDTTTILPIPIDLFAPFIKRSESPAPKEPWPAHRIRRSSIEQRSLAYRKTQPSWPKFRVRRNKGGVDPVGGKYSIRQVRKHSDLQPEATRAATLSNWCGQSIQKVSEERDQRAGWVAKTVQTAN